MLQERLLGLLRIIGGMKPTYGKTSPKVMYFSAKGPDPEDDSFENFDVMKPNLVAPGNSIWGAVILASVQSILSMSALDVAGIAALNKQKFPHFTAASIASAMSIIFFIRQKT
ncbi:unnamed protein product [Cochlearia groenlandica]